MTSVLNVDTIADKAGTGPVALTKQFAARVWNCFDADVSGGPRDSFNTSSMTDNGTGHFDTNVTSSFVNDDFAFGATVGKHSGAAIQILGGSSSTAKDTGQYGVINQNYQGAFGDSADYMTTAHGDLA